MNAATIAQLRERAARERNPACQIPGFPPLTQPMLLDLLEYVPPVQIAHLFSLPYETLLLLTGIDFDYWTTGVVPEEGVVAFMAADPTSGLPTSAIICVRETPDDEARVRAQLGDLGMPVVYRFKGQYAE